MENPAYPLLGPNIWILKTWGMWQPLKTKTNTIYNIIHIFAILFVLSQYVELWLIRSNLDMALRNLSISMLSTICVIKASTFVILQNDWRNIIDYISKTEITQIKIGDAVTNNIIKNYIKYSRRVTYFYSGLTSATVFVVIVTPLASYLSSSEFRELIKNETLPYPETMSSWAPFDRTRGYGYWIITLMQSLICIYGGGIVAGYDTNAVVVMSFFKGQLNILKTNCERMFKEKMMNYEDAIKNIRDCHIHHNNLVKYSRSFNSLLSPVMFIYVIICSLMICASAIQLTTEDTTNMQKIWIAEYLVALIAQLFLYCWHSNEVLQMSNKLNQGVFASAWWAQSVRVRRCVLLLGGQLEKTIEFSAGPFTKLSIPTFVAILKGSYSYYTLLSKVED